jgi:hypothetical protein
MKNFLKHNIKKPIPYEYKRIPLYLLKFPEEMGINVYVLKSVTKPKYSFINNYWDNMVVKLLDPIEPSVPQVLFDIITNQTASEKDYKLIIIVTD